LRFKQGRGDNKQLFSLIKQAQHSENLRLSFTSREHLWQEAKQSSEAAGALRNGYQYSLITDPDPKFHEERFWTSMMYLLYRYVAAREAGAKARQDEANGKAREAEAARKAETVSKTKEPDVQIKTNKEAEQSVRTNAIQNGLSIRAAEK